MFRLFDAEDENKFTWESIGDVIDGRKNLGRRNACICIPTISIYD